MNFSIIVATYNRSKYLRICLKKLAKINYPQQKFEVIVIDNKSTDNTTNVVQKFQADFPKISIRYIQESKAGISYARNRGIKEAKYRKIVFIDDDILVNPNIMTIYAQTYKDFPQAAIIGGKITPSHQPKNINSTKQWIVSKADFCTQTKVLKYPQVPFSANCSLDLNKFKQPVFDTHFGRYYRIGPLRLFIRAEDFELFLRTSLSNKQIIYQPKASVQHQIDPNRININKSAFFAGLERYLIDKKLGDKFKTHRRYSYKDTYYDIKDIIKKHTKDYCGESLYNIFYALGYYGAGRIFDFIFPRSTN